VQLSTILGKKASVGWRVALAVALIAGVLACWIAIDLADSIRHDLRDFDGHVVARIETAMWRSYYDHHQVRLFFQLTELLRSQYHLPFWRACNAAYYAARAAVVFQKGRSHADYDRALPDLRRYYWIIRQASTNDFSVWGVASLELQWWIVHRERATHDPEVLYLALAKLQAEIYHLPEELPGEKLWEHARTRGEAMLLRDSHAARRTPSEAEWRRIEALLDQSWTSLHTVVAH